MAARVCRLLALLAALASAKEKKVIGPTSKLQLPRCTPGPGTDEHEDCITREIAPWFWLESFESSLGSQWDPPAASGRSKMVRVGAKTSEV